MSHPHYLPSHSGFLPQTLNVSLRDSHVLSLCRPPYFPFLPPPPSIIIALTLEGQFKCHIAVREPVWWCMVGHPVPFQSPVWLWLTVRWRREDPSGQSNIRPLRWPMGTVSSLSAASHLRACVCCECWGARSENNDRIMSRKESQCHLDKWEQHIGEVMIWWNRLKEKDQALWKPLWSPAIDVCACVSLHAVHAYVCMCGYVQCVSAGL